MNVIGELFLRDAGSGLYMTTGILSAKDLPDECIVPAMIRLEVEKARDVQEISIGRSAGGMLLQTLWRVPRAT